MPYTVADWVAEMGMRSIAEAADQGHHTVVAELITAMGNAGLITDRQLANPRASKQLARPGEPAYEEPEGRYPLVGHERTR